MDTLRSCSLMRRDKLSWWLKLQQKKCHAFFFPLLAKELAQSQPVTVWNPRRVLHNLSPMCIMHWNKTAFIIHVGVKPQFRPVQASKKSMVEIKHAELYHSSHAFFFYFWHCLGTGLAVTLICTFEANGCFIFLCWNSPPLMEFTQHCSKIMWTCRQLLEKSRALKMLKSSSDNSPKVFTTEDFVICRTAMLWIITTFGFVDAVSCWTTFTPFLRLPSWLASEYATKDSSKLSSACQTSPCWGNSN